MPDIILKINDKAPDFCLPNQDNIEICLKDFHDKWIVLYFYPRDNTSGCTREAREFTENLKEFNRLSAIVIGISPDSVKSHRNFIRKHGLRITLLSDADHDVLDLYKVWQLKKLYGREYYGVVRSTFIIDPEGKIEYIWRKVKVKGHVEEVLNKLKGLIALRKM